jgi:hypothetical protein
MDSESINRYLDDNLENLKKQKPTILALENARFYLQLFKQFKLLQQR